MQHAFGYKYCLINIMDKQNHTTAKERSYYGNDCVNDMLANLTDDWKEISSALNYPLNICEEDRKKHTEKNQCDICKCRFNKTDCKKMKHHFHYLRENNYAGTLCCSCNLKIRTPHYLPVVAHNLSYDRVAHVKGI